MQDYAHNLCLLLVVFEIILRKFWESEKNANMELARDGMGAVGNKRNVDNSTIISLFLFSQQTDHLIVLLLIT